MSEYRQIQASWLVSPDIPTRIDEIGQQDVSLLSIAMACNSGELGEAIAKRIISDHNGCIGIEGPETTVPELVDVLREVAASGVQFDDPRLDYVVVQISRVTMDEIKALLAKTGKVNDPP